MSFRLKTILGIAIIESVFLLALVASSLYYLSNSNEKGLKRRANLASTLLATAATDAVLSTDVARLEQLANDFLKNQGMVYVRVMDNERILAEGGAPDALQRPFKADDDLNLVDDGVYDVSAFVREAGQNYGRVEIGLSIDIIQAIIEEAYFRTISLAILEISLVALFSWILGTYLTRQLTYLESASNKVADGNFSIKLPVRGRDELARVSKAFNSMTDHILTTYHDLENALSEAMKQRERLKSVLDSEEDGVVAINRQGVINLFSQSAEKMFGYSADEVIGQNVNMLMAEPYKSVHERNLKKYIEDGDDRILSKGREIEGLRKDGTLFPMELTISELNSIDEKGFISLVRDISERKRLDEQLRSSESMKKAMLESSLDAIITIDQHGYICEFNQSASVVFGYTVDEVIGNLLSDLIIPEKYREAHRQGLQRYLETGKSKILGQRFEITAIGRWGEEFPIEIAITPIRQGSQIYFTAFIRNITESKQAEEALLKGREQAEHASLVKSQFLAMMSHEIRTPLNAILGTQDLLDETPLDPAQKNYLAMAKDAGNTLMNLINDILDITKVEAGKLELENTEFNPVQVINEVLQVIEPKAKEKKLMVIKLISPEVTPSVVGDPWRLRQVLLNLLTNAVKFTPKGNITLKLSPCPSEQTGGLLLFEVIDEGIGIPEDIQSRLFDMFTQADPSDTRKYGGSGLGLAISKRLVELWGGHLGLESRLGVGSRFWFCFGGAVTLPKLPLVSENEVNVTEQLPVQAAKLLLVEDSPTNQVVISTMLRNVGHTVDVVDCGAAAIAAVQAKSYDLIFMDVSMPDMSGMEATQIIRQLGGAAARVPIIAITAHAVKGYREDCLASGMNDYATKPISKKELRVLTSKWLSREGSELTQEPVSISHVEAKTEGITLDEETLRQLAEDTGLESVRELLIIYIDELVVRREAIEEAIERRNITALGYEVHALKSGAATFGAWDLHALAVEMDVCCKKGDLASALALAERLLPCADATLVALKSHCAA